MANRHIRLVLILLAAGLPLSVRLLFITLSSKGLIEAGYGAPLLFIPLDVCLFGFCFSLAQLAGKQIGAKCIITRALLFSFSLVCVNAALALGYMFSMLFFAWGAAYLLAPVFSAGICLVLYGYFMQRFLEGTLTKPAYIRLFLLGSVASGAQHYLFQMFPAEFAIHPGEQLASSAWYIAAAAGLYFERTLAARENPARLPTVAPIRKRTVLSLKLGLGLAIVPPLLLLIALVVALFISFDGYCYGFTDGKWACSVWGSLATQLQLALIFFSLPALGWMGVLLLMTDFKRVLRPGAGKE